MGSGPTQRIQRPLTAMQRGLYAIALSDQSVEGGLVSRGEVQPEFNQSLLALIDPPPPEQTPRTLLEAFLQQAQWERGMGLLVLTTDQVSYRRLHFEFSDPKKIRQVLPLELESELLDGVAGHAYDVDIARREDGSADVDVYLVDADPLQAAVAALEQHQVGVLRVTFSAQALAQTLPAESERHFQVYVGCEETFVSHIQDGRLHTVHALFPHPGQVLSALKALGPGSPIDQLQALYRADVEDAERTALRETLRERLESVLEEANRFLRINSGGADFTVSTHGLFGELYRREEGASSLKLHLPQGAWPGARRNHFGILDELLSQPRAFPNPRGLNFHKRVGTWIALARELRWPLVAAAALLVVLLGLAGSAYALRASALQARLTAVGQQLQRTLSVQPPITSITVNAALGRVQERLDRLRKDRQAVEALDRYHYNTLQLFNDVSNAVHSLNGVSVDSLSFNQEHFTLSGVVPSYAESESLRSKIADMPRFKGRQVKVTNSNVGKAIRFRLTVEK